MKRSVSILLVLVFLLTGCSNSSKKESEEDTENEYVLSFDVSEYESHSEYVNDRILCTKTVADLSSSTKMFAVFDGRGNQISEWIDCDMYGTGSGLDVTTVAYDEYGYLWLTTPINVSQSYYGKDVFDKDFNLIFSFDGDDLTDYDKNHYENNVMLVHNNFGTCDWEIGEIRSHWTIYIDGNRYLFPPNEGNEIKYESISDSDYTMETDYYLLTDSSNNIKYIVLYTGSIGKNWLLFSFDKDDERVHYIANLDDACPGKSNLVSIEEQLASNGTIKAQLRGADGKLYYTAFNTIRGDLAYQPTTDKSIADEKDASPATRLKVTFKLGYDTFSYLDDSVQDLLEDLIVKEVEESLGSSYSVEIVEGGYERLMRKLDEHQIDAIIAPYIKIDESEANELGWQQSNVVFYSTDIISDKEKVAFVIRIADTEDGDKLKTVINSALNGGYSNNSKIKEVMDSSYSDMGTYVRKCMDEGYYCIE